jgi:hypothetical protein
MADQPHLLDNGGRMSASTCAKCHRFGPLCDCPPMGAPGCKPAAKPEHCPQCRKPWNGRECELCGYRREADVEPRAATGDAVVHLSSVNCKGKTHHYIFDSSNIPIAEVPGFMLSDARRVVAQANAAPKLTEALRKVANCSRYPKSEPENTEYALDAMREIARKALEVS